MANLLADSITHKAILRAKLIFTLLLLPGRKHSLLEVSRYSGNMFNAECLPGRHEVQKQQLLYLQKQLDSLLTNDLVAEWCSEKHTAFSSHLSCVASDKQ